MNRTIPATQNGRVETFPLPPGCAFGVVRGFRAAVHGCGGALAFKHCLDCDTNAYCNKCGAKWTWRAAIREWCVAT